MRFSAADKRPKRIFIDGSYTLCSGKTTGIERVVRNLIAHSSNLPTIPQRHVVMASGGIFVKLHERHLKSLARPAAVHGNVLAHLPKVYKSVADLATRGLPAPKLRRSLLPQPGHLGIFKLPHTIFEKATRLAVARRARPVAFTNGDILLLPDAYWGTKGVWEPVAHARANGALVATVLYDLIPLTHPQFIGGATPPRFLNYLQCVAKYSDLIVAISNTVRDQMVEYMQANCAPGTHCEDVRSFELGADLALTDGPVRESLRQLMSDSQSASPPFLCVGTFEPRKNHAYLLEAFELLWQSRPEARLMLVGRPGWECDPLLQKLAEHPRRDRQLFVFHDLSDAELQHCYRSCRAIIHPSCVEGFGLPIVESLWHGKQTFASDTAIHREVGGQACTYFDLADPGSLVSALCRWEDESEGATPQSATRRALSWQESSRALFASCVDAFGQRRSGPELSACA